MIATLLQTGVGYSPTGARLRLLPWTAAPSPRVRCATPSLWIGAGAVAALMLRANPAMDPGVTRAQPRDCGSPTDEPLLAPPSPPRDTRP